MRVKWPMEGLGRRVAASLSAGCGEVRLEKSHLGRKFADESLFVRWWAWMDWAVTLLRMEVDIVNVVLISGKRWMRIINLSDVGTSWFRTDQDRSFD